MDYHQHYERNLCPKKQHPTRKLLQLPGNITWHTLMDKTNIIQLWIRKLQWTLTNEPDHDHDPLRADLHPDFIDFRNPRADFTDPVHDHSLIDRDLDLYLDPADDFHDHNQDLTHDLDQDHHFDDNIPILDPDDHPHFDLIIVYPNHDNDHIHHEQDPEVHDNFLMNSNCKFTLYSKTIAFTLTRQCRLWFIAFRHALDQPSCAKRLVDGVWSQNGSGGGAGTAHGV